MLALALLFACGDPVVSGTFTTYNAGLAVGFVPGAVERTPLVADAIAGLEADVVCLQEVWSPEQVAAVEAAASSAFPHRYFPPADPVVDPAPACPDGMLDGLVECATESCGDLCLDELVGCVQSSCAFDFVALEQTCLRCAFANVGGEIDAIADACASQTTEYAYGGSFGTGILSKHPILSTELEVFASTSNRRAVIHAVVELPSGPFDVYCTHLTAAFDSIPYPRDEGGWSEEQTVQVEGLRAFVDATASGPLVLMGDFNNGPDGEGLVSEEFGNYQMLQQGFDTPYLDQDGRCTFCGDNPLVGGGGDDADSELIDHVFVRGLEAPTYAVARVLDGTVEHGTCGADITGAYSDHYGVQVTINPEE